MTREEAIRILDPETTGEAISGIEYYGGFSGRTAAVQAVSDACILAVAAIREHGHWRWIPVTERLPESEGNYLVYTERGSVYTSHFYEKKVFRDNYVRGPRWSQRGKVRVTYWMPLPEPPKEE